MSSVALFPRLAYSSNDGNSIESGRVGGSGKGGGAHDSGLENVRISGDGATDATVVDDDDDDDDDDDYAADYGYVFKADEGLCRLTARSTRDTPPRYIDIPW